MTKIKSFSKKALSIVLTLVMCLTLIPLMSDTAPEAEAATAGLYDIKVEVTVTNGADGWDQNDHYVNHKSNNGTGTQTAQSVGLSTGNMDEEKTHTFTYSNKGFPTSYTYNYSFGGGLTWRKLEFTLKVYASKAGANSWKQVMSGSFSDESSAFSAANGTWTCSASSNIAAPSSISWTNTAKSITVPKSGTATVKTSSATVYDQYGVEWYQEPYYAINSSTSATTTTESISGITRTTSQSDTCTVSVTNPARTWVDNGGGNSRDVYVTAYINSVKSSTTKVTVNQVQYDVKFYNEGTLLNTDSANQKFYYNDRPYYNGTPVKTADAQYSYVFDGWTASSDGSGTVYTVSNLPFATADATYYAHYNKITNQYTVTFKNDDGTTLQSGKLYYGDTPVYSGTPVKESTPQYSYVFAGWTPEISEVTEEVIYTATYNAVLNKYTVVFKNYDGTVLQESACDYGSIPSCSITPVKPSDEKYDYVFKGWNPTVNPVTGDAEYTAAFTAVKRSYPVVFKNYDGTVLQNTAWEYGTTPSYSGTPVRESNAEFTYTFTGWSPAIVSVTGNAEYTAVFEAKKNEYTVYYKNYDGSAVSEETVLYGEAAQMADSLSPVKPAADGKTYVFAGWSAELGSITKNTYAVAQYAVEGVENYWVTFVDSDGTVLYKTIVEEGGTAVYGGEEPTNEGYSFVGWDKPLTDITEDTTVYALYAKDGEQYVVTYVDWDDTFIVSMIVNHGEDAVAPAAPVREGDENTVYTFTGWDNDGTNVTENLVIKATYSVHTHEYNTFVENVIPADCITNRTDKFSCSCGLTKDIEIENSKDATKHTGPLTLKNVQNETCTDNGYSGDMVCEACGQIDTYGEVITAPGHSKGEAVFENVNDGSCTVAGTFDEVYYCTVCNEVISRETKTGEKLPHTLGEVVTEKVIAPSCTVDGSHEEATYCTVCGTEISRENKIDPSTGHDYEETVTSPTCTEDGYTTYICSVCGDTYTDDIIGANGHTPKEAVKEKEIKASCTVAAYHEDVVYCDICGIEISRTPVNGTTIPHTQEAIPAVEATCTKTGLTAGVKCSVCGEILTAQTETPALDHDMGEYVETKPATCTEVGEERADCSRCDYFVTREIEKKAHTEEAIPEVEATCTETGLTAGVKCSVCGEILTAQEETSKLGHDMSAFVVTTPATCTEVGEERADCSRCDYFVTREIEKKAHTEEAIPEVEATCTETGLTAGVKCSVCGEILTAQEETPKLGHDMSAFVVTTPATCTEVGEERSDCSRCDYFETNELPLAEHTEEEIPAVAPTCEADGLTAGIKCSVCGEILKAQETDPKLGHDMGAYVETKPATCTEAGEERADCANCDYFETREIAKAAHTEEEIPAVAPTCTEDGLTAGVKCSVCKEILKAQEKDPATDHNWGEWFTVTPASCGSDGEEKRVCKNDENHFETQPVKATGAHVYATEIERVPASCTEDGYVIKACLCGAEEKTTLTAPGHTEEEIPAVAPTCIEDGLTAGVKCSGCDEVLKAQETDPKLGHDMGAYVETKPATCTEVGEERADCSRCDYFVTREIEKKAHTEEEIPAVAPTCEEDGLTAGIKCSVCDEILKAQETDPKLGHDMGAYVETKPATCTEVGEERADCSRCDYFVTREIEKKAHTEEEIPAVAPTCEEDGLTAGIKCSVCDEILKAQETDPKLGHDMGAYVETKTATCTEVGEERADCSRCDYFVTREIEKKAHTEEEIPAVAATCTETGLTAGVKCSVCDEILVAQTETPVIAHAMGEFTVTTPATCSAAGEERADCANCDYFETREIAKAAHTEEEIPAVAPTCTTAGSTAGIKCTVCGEIVKAPVAVGKTAHDMGEWIEIKAPTCTETGLEESKCKNCDYTETREIAEKDHEYNEDGVCTGCNKEHKCPHICHKEYNFFARFIWGIIRFVCSLFGIGRTCSCGAAHY